jgi:hypothetical protein
MYTAYASMNTSEKPGRVVVIWGIGGYMYVMLNHALVVDMLGPEVPPGSYSRLPKVIVERLRQSVEPASNKGT